MHNCELNLQTERIMGKISQSWKMQQNLDESIKVERGHCITK